MTGQDPTNPQWKRTGIHLKPGWTAVHLRPGQNDYCPQAGWKVIHSPPEQ